MSAETPALRAHLGKGLGVVATDINNDGRMDLFVANDTVPNFLFVNRGGAVSKKRGLLAGVALQRRRAARVPAWESTPPTSTRTAGWTCLSPTSTRRFFALSEQPRWNL